MTVVLEAVFLVLAAVVVTAARSAHNVNVRVAVSNTGTKDGDLVKAARRVGVGLLPTA